MIIVCSPPHLFGYLKDTKCQSLIMLSTAKWTNWVTWSLSWSFCRPTWANLSRRSGVAVFARDCRHICPRHRHCRASPINPPVNIDSEPPFCGEPEKSADFIPRPFIFDPRIDREQSGRVAKASVAQLEICAQLLIAANHKTLKKEF